MFLVTASIFWLAFVYESSKPAPPTPDWIEYVPIFGSFVGAIACIIAYLVTL